MVSAFVHEAFHVVVHEPLSFSEKLDEPKGRSRNMNKWLLKCFSAIAHGGVDFVPAAGACLHGHKFKREIRNVMSMLSVIQR